ncbi:helix-turn-helix domain-containing protein [Williamsia herbipolensis]|uniref:helix-turn-helix domain-containing protein n=1 Tax=Williamsia herbipolensis TaxID=1603258 RepID=UPI0009E31AD3|nr:helix-turn-helix domain-containing protein [Williamsia herbipolensis]
MLTRNNTEPVGVLTAREAAAEIGVSLATIRRRVADGSLPAHRVGGRPGAAVRIRRADLDALLVPTRE